jgi:hypothetical protein
LSVTSSPAALSEASRSRAAEAGFLTACLAADSPAGPSVAAPPGVLGSAAGSLAVALRGAARFAAAFPVSLPRIAGSLVVAAVSVRGSAVPRFGAALFDVVCLPAAFLASGPPGASRFAAAFPGAVFVAVCLVLGFDPAVVVFAVVVAAFVVVGVAAVLLAVSDASPASPPRPAADPAAGPRFAAASRAEPAPRSGAVLSFFAFALLAVAFCVGFFAAGLFTAVLLATMAAAPSHSVILLANRDRNDKSTASVRQRGRAGLPALCPARTFA